jgi:hypothetical protein
MIGFVALIALLGAVACLGGCWISWESQDPKVRPPFTAKFVCDVMQLFRGHRSVAPATRVRQDGNRSQESQG